jgi:hypothetical protein
VKDTGPIAGESFAEKVARLKAVSAGAKQRADEGGGDHAPTADRSMAALESEVATATPALPPPVETGVTNTPAVAHKPTGNADRSLNKRSTYCGVVDTGPVAGESFEQKVARLAKVAAAAKQRSEGG